jgi:nucleoside-triphosphatase
MRVLLTGRPGSGKTTVCTRVVDIARKRGLTCCGVLTHQLRRGEESASLIVEDLSTREKRILARKREDMDGGEGVISCSFIFDRDGIEFGKRALERGGDLLVIDEVGNLEINGEGFTNAMDAFSSRENSILAVRSELSEIISQRLKCGFRELEIEEKTRDDLPEAIFDMMFNNSGEDATIWNGGLA